MKKITLLLFTFISLALTAQNTDIFDFESDFTGKWGTNANPTNNATNEDHITFTIVDNPDASGINTSAKVGKFRRLQNGLWWAYAWFEFEPVYIDASVTNPKYIHLSIYKPLISTVCVQLKNAVTNVTVSTGEVKSNSQTLVNGWQELTFKITTPGTYGYIEIKPDFVNAVVSTRLTEDIDIYFDNIFVNNDLSVAGEDPIALFAGSLPEDFESESTLLNPIEYAGDRFGSFIQAYDATDVTVADNPLKIGNMSEKCGKFIRKKDGPWNAGFYMIPATGMTADATNKYFHIMVYKTMESPINLKLETGSPVATTGDLKVTPAASDAGKWADYVFEIPEAKYSTYSKISLFLDFIQTPAPSERFTEDQAIYFDNIEINSSPDLRIGGIGTQISGTGSPESFRAWKDDNGDIRVINNTETASGVVLFDLVGKTIMTSTVRPGTNVIPATDLHGIYILKTTSGNFKLTF